MGDAIRAEWLKITHYRWLTGLMVWIFPMGALALMAMFLIISLLSGPQQQLNTGALNLDWTTQMLSPWLMVSNALGQWIVVSFAAVVFAGESGWHTWKNILTRAPRHAILVAKFVTVIGLFFIALNMMAIILGVGSALIVQVNTGAIQPVINAETIRQFAQAYAIQLLNGTFAITLSTVYAALGALIARSVIAGVMAGIVINLIDQLAYPILYYLGLLFNQPEWVTGTLLTPSYNLQNVASWASIGQGYQLSVLGSSTSAPDVAFSIAVVVLWIAGLSGLLVGLFRRFDIP